jgi:DNA-binding MarR family transcriptional regulator
MREDLVKQFTEQMEEIKRHMMSHKFPMPDCKLPTPSQVRVLFLLNDKKEGLSVKEIAELLEITGSAATQLIDGLFDEGFVNRVEDLIDRRRMVVSLSEQAKERMAQVKEFHLSKFKELTRLLSDEELLTLVGIQQKMILALKEEKNTNE